MVQEKSHWTRSDFPTTQNVPGALEEARAVAPQLGSSVYLASVVCLLCILILISSERDLMLVGKRHTSNALWLRLREEEQPENSPILWTENCCLMEFKLQGGLRVTWVNFAILI